MRTIFTSFAAFTAIYPVLNASSYVFEGYAVAGVRTVKAEGTAFPHRADNILLSPLMVYAPDAGLDSIVAEFGKRARKTLYEDRGERELHAYVNYAYGNERLRWLNGWVVEADEAEGVEEVVWSGWIFWFLCSYREGEGAVLERDGEDGWDEDLGTGAENFL
jgi:hypothetical protein